MSLSVNSFRKNILCSGSADHSIKIWDVCTKNCVQTYNIHKDKVQVAKWNPQEESVLFSAGFDRKIQMFDARSSQNVQTNKTLSDIESACWDPNNPVRIAFSCEDGTVGMIDARKFEADYLFNVQAHHKSCTSVAMSKGIEGMLATTGVDGKVKIWDVKDNMQAIVSKDMKADKLFCGNFNQDNPWLLGCGSSVGEIVIWDCAVQGQVSKHFGPRAAVKPHQGDEENFMADENKDDVKDFEDDEVDMEC